MTAWKTRNLEVVTSSYILGEFKRVLTHMPQCTLTETKIQRLANLLLFLAEVRDPDPIVVNELRDKDDLPILALLLECEADYLITGDKDLLTLPDEYMILSPSEFWHYFGF